MFITLVTEAHPQWSVEANISGGHRWEVVTEDLCPWYNDCMVNLTWGVLAAGSWTG